MQSSQQSRRAHDDVRHGDLHVRWLLALRSARTLAHDDGLALRKPVLSSRMVGIVRTHVHGRRIVADDDNGLDRRTHMR